MERGAVRWMPWSPGRRDEDFHLRLGRAFLAPSEVLQGLGANPLVFVGLSAILPLLHTYSYTFKILKES